MSVSATAENANHMMTITLNLWNSTNAGIMPTAMDVPSPPPENGRQYRVVFSSRASRGAGQMEVERRTGRDGRGRNSKGGTDVHSCAIEQMTMIATANMFEVSTLTRHAKKSCTRAAMNA